MPVAPIYPPTHTNMWAKGKLIPIRLPSHLQSYAVPVATNKKSPISTPVPPPPLSVVRSQPLPATATTCPLACPQLSSVPTQVCPPSLRPRSPPLLPDLAPPPLLPDLPMWKKDGSVVGLPTSLVALSWLSDRKMRGVSSVPFGSDARIATTTNGLEELTSALLLPVASINSRRWHGTLLGTVHYRSTWAWEGTHQTDPVGAGL